MVFKTDKLLDVEAIIKKGVEQSEHDMKINP
jgi:hypothetical protein